MLSQMQRLSAEADGRYATDDELKFLAEYLRSFDVRVQTYQKLQALEATVIQQVHEKMLAQDPGLFRSGTVDLTPKWKRDAIRTWRYSATALLMDDPDTLRERFLIWFQTVMHSFGAQRSCEVTYTVFKDVVQSHLSPQQLALLVPILEMNRSVLSV
jgi:Phycobilisome protein